MDTVFLFFCGVDDQKNKLTLAGAAAVIEDATGSGFKMDGNEAAGVEAGRLVVDAGSGWVR